MYVQICYLYILKCFLISALQCVCIVYKYQPVWEELVEHQLHVHHVHIVSTQASRNMEKMAVGVAVLLSICVTITISPSYASHEFDENRRNYLVIDLLREDRVDGSYMNPELGCGVVFNGTKDGLTLSSLDGRRLLSAGEQVGPIRLVTLGNREFIQHKESVESNAEDSGESGTVRDYAIPKYHGSFADTRDHKTFMNLIQKLKKLNPNAHSRVLKKSVKRVLSKCEINLLSEAAFTMGHHHGITSQEYPSTLPLYMTASRMNSRSKSHPNADMNHQQVDVGSKHKRLKREESCLDKCPPCKSKECLGMCGPGCVCWNWLCGNCCYNKGCYDHDLCCRSKPNSLACILPMSFDCDSKYICEEPTTANGVQISSLLKLG